MVTAQKKKSDSNCYTLTTFYDQGGLDSVKFMTNFKLEEFTEVWLLMAEHVARFQNTERRKRSRTGGRNA